MELTPIKVRRKRRRAGEPAPQLTKLPANADRKRARRKKRRKDDTRGNPSRTRASYFEREVPLEVLESIFWQSENINLPLSSLRFGWLLSGRPTLRQTFINAFAPTWDTWHGYVQSSTGSGPCNFSLGGHEAAPREWKGNPEFQSALLRQPWADISLILESEQFWCNKFARDRFYEPAKLWGVADSFDSPEVDSHAENSVRNEFIHDYTAFRQVERMRLPLEASRVNTSSAYVRVHKDTRIPDDLLTGPWPDERSSQKLFWLVRAGCRLSEDQTWELTLEGFRIAIWGRATLPSKTGQAALADIEHKVNLMVIRIFVALGAFQLWPHWAIKEEFERLVDRLQRPERHTPAQLHSYLHTALEIKRVYPDPGGEYWENTLLAFSKDF